MTLNPDPTPDRIVILMPHHVFVFGSNREGRHGAGAAHWALKNFGARWGVGEGFQGRCYAIPTKSTPYEPLSLPEIAAHVRRFLDVARLGHGRTFLVTRIGTGLAGYTDSDMAPLFAAAPDNVRLPKQWLDVLCPDLSESGR